MTTINRVWSDSDLSGYTETKDEVVEQYEAVQVMHERIEYLEAKIWSMGCAMAVWSIVMAVLVILIMTGSV